MAQERRSSHTLSAPSASGRSHRGSVRIRPVTVDRGMEYVYGVYPLSSRLRKFWWAGISRRVCTRTARRQLSPFEACTHLLLCFIVLAPAGPHLHRARIDGSPALSWVIASVELRLVQLTPAPIMSVVLQTLPSLPTQGLEPSPEKAKDARTRPARRTAPPAKTRFGPHRVRLNPAEPVFRLAG